MASDDDVVREHLRKQLASESRRAYREQVLARRFARALVALADHPQGCHIPKRITSVVAAARAMLPTEAPRP